MSRTTSDLVKAVLAAGQDYDLDNNPDLAAYIQPAVAITNRIAACATNRGMGMQGLQVAGQTVAGEDTEGTELELIERYLAAHFYVQSDENYQSKTTAGASANFQGRTDMGIDASKYGQTAKRIDWSGCLTIIDKRQFASSFWLGKYPSAQIPYDEKK